MDEFARWSAERDALVRRIWEAMPPLQIRRGGITYPTVNRGERADMSHLEESGGWCAPSSVIEDLTDPQPARRRPTRKELKARIKELETRLSNPIVVTLKLGNARDGLPGVQVFQVQPGTWQTVTVTAIAAPIEATPAVPGGPHFMMSTQLQVGVSR